MDLSSTKRETPPWLVAAAVVIVLAVGGWLLVRHMLVSPDENRRGNLWCEPCGHRFEMAAGDYHAALAGQSGPGVPCPKCGRAAAEPVMADCPHCRKPIRHRDVQQGSRAHAEHLCPFCEKKLPS